MVDSGPGPVVDHPLSVRPVAESVLRLLKRHWSILWPVAAAFFFLPQLLIGIVAPPAPPAEVGAASGNSIPFVLAGVLVVMATITGQLTIAYIAVHDGTNGQTVGQLISRSARRVIPALAVVAIQSIATVFGLLLFLIPGLWALARLAVSVPIIAVGPDDPIAAIRSSWEMTRGYALRLLGCLAALLFVVLFLYLSVMAFGIATGAVTPSSQAVPFSEWTLARLLFEVAASASVALTGLIATCYYARLLVVLRALPRIEA